jgi:hypothetical protein
LFNHLSESQRDNDVKNNNNKNKQQQQQQQQQQQTTKRFLKILLA